MYIGRESAMGDEQAQMGKASTVGILSAFSGLTESVVPTGLDFVDELTGGIKPGDLWVVSGEGATGKSTLVQRIAARTALSGVDVVYHSLEETPENLGARIVTRLSKERACKFEDETFQVLDRRLQVVTMPSASAEDLCVIVEGLSDGEPAVLVIDGFSLMASPLVTTQRYEQVSQAARTLKRTAMDRGFSVVVTVPAQAERTVRGVPTRRSPRLSDIRGSRDLADLADVIILLDRADPEGEDQGVDQGVDQDEGTPESDEVVVRVAKNRRGELGIGLL